MRTTNSKLLLDLALVLFVSKATFAATPETFTDDRIQKIWPELWHQAKPEIKAPEIDPLSEAQVAKEMAGKWLSSADHTERTSVSFSVACQNHPIG